MSYPSVYSALKTCRERLAPLCEAPDLGRFYPNQPDGGVLLQVEEVVCAFAGKKISFKQAQADFVKAILPLLDVDVPEKIKSRAVARNIVLWLSSNRSYAMSVDFLLRQIEEEEEIRQWVANHAGNLQEDEARRDLKGEALEPLADWFKNAREMEVALIMLWADSMAAAASLGCPNTPEATDALAALGEEINRCNLVATANKLVESTEDIDYSGLPSFFLDYETQEDFELIGEAPPGESLNEYRASQEAERQVKEKSGVKTIYVLLKAAAYLRWLADSNRKNNLRSRMRFACETWIKAGGVKL